MSTEELEARVRGLLADLGETPDAIAGELARLGIHGRPQEEADCPVFHYLKRFSIPVRTVDPGLIDAKECLVVTPQPVGDFIVAFDHGHYPELELMEAES